MRRREFYESSYNLGLEIVHEVPAACEFRQIGGNTKTTFFTQNNFRMYLTYQWGLRPVLFTIYLARIGQQINLSLHHPCKGPSRAMLYTLNFYVRHYREVRRAVETSSLGLH